MDFDTLDALSDEEIKQLFENIETYDSEKIGACWCFTGSGYVQFGDYAFGGCAYQPYSYNNCRYTCYSRGFTGPGPYDDGCYCARKNSFMHVYNC